MTVRLLGVRDLLLGAATVTAASRAGGPASGRGAIVGWALAGAVADGADLAGTLANRSRLPRSALGIAVLAGLGTGAGLALACAGWSARE